MPDAPASEVLAVDLLDVEPIKIHVEASQVDHRHVTTSRSLVIPVAQPTHRQGNAPSMRRGAR